MRLSEIRKTNIVNALAEKAMNNSRIEELKKLLAHNIRAVLLSKAPRNWEQIIDYIYTVSTIWVRTPHNGSIMLKYDEPVPVTKASYSGGIKFTSKADLGDYEARILDEITELLDEKEKARKLFRDIVQAATTDKRLVEMLPEAGPIIQELYGMTGGTTSLVPVEQVAAARALLKEAL